MKILALSNLYPPDVMGGYEIICAQAVDALRARGHLVEVLTGSPRMPVKAAAHVHRRFKLVEDRDWVAGEEGNQDPRIGRRDVESRIVSAHNVHILLDLLEQFAPDVVYLHNLIGLGGLGLIACLQYLGVPWAWQLADCIPAELCFAGDPRVAGLSKEFSRTVKGHYLAVSRQLCNEIETRGSRLNGGLEIAPLWIAGEGRRGSRPDTRGSTLRIISAGRVNRQKGVDILIESAALLRDSGRDDFLIDVYGAVADPTLAALIRQRDLTNHVSLMGPRPYGELRELYGNYDVFAFPTREREPFGVVPLEALARGCVPVMTRRCGAAEWLVHGVHCLKAARTATAFAEIFGRILDGEIALGPLARRGEEVVWRDFHLDSIIPRVERRLAIAAAEPKPASGTASEAYKLARLAEKLANSWVSESLCAGA